jgi:glycosyltransferase involved in cell wall biosynthesis
MDVQVSIIVPYKQTFFKMNLAICLKNYTNWECIIVNDGSPDDTKRSSKMVQEITDLSPQKKTADYHLARNAGITISKGDIFTFDVDDILHKDYLKLLVSYTKILL